MKLLKTACVLWLVSVLSLSAAAENEPPVRASLVAAETSIQPGRAFTVALRLEHAEHWHTYWKNPGTGLATSLSWELPAGWTAGEVQWPTPRAFRDAAGSIAGHGYEGTVLLPVVIQPPADVKVGGDVTLRARAAWLMCRESCVPGSAVLELAMPVEAEAPKPDRLFGEDIHATVAALPRVDPAWRATATREGGNIMLHLAPAVPRSEAPRGVHFFSADGVIAHDRPQQAVPDGQGGVVLALAVAEDAGAGATTLHGVVAADAGWLAAPASRGLLIAAELPPAGAPAAAAGGAGTLLFAFLGGLVLNLMPCVFPVLGLKILGFVNQAGSKRRRIVSHSLAFTSGVLLSFWALAGALAVLRAGGGQLGWGFQLQSPAFVYALAVLLLVFAMNMSGVFEFGLRATSVGGRLQSKEGYAGSFFTGVLATVVATPCSAPFLAPALGAALAVSTAESAAIFTAIALGLSAPYLLLSVFPQAVKILPRPGAWMETFKQFMAFPLYATVAYLAWVLAGQVGEEGLRDALVSLALLALAVWIYGRWSAPGASARRLRLGFAGLMSVGAVGLWLGWPRDSLAAGAGSATAGPAIVWEAWSPEAVARLRAEGRPIYVDFTARWCATCQTNKKFVFGSKEVLKFFAENKVATLRADWTSKDPRITAELARHGRSAVPFNVVWPSGGAAPAILPEILTARTVLDALQPVRVAAN